MLEKLYMDNRGLIGMWIRHYTFLWKDNPVCDADDLMQAGFLGLVAAARTFDPDAGSWSGWASYHIRTAILDTLGMRRKHARTVSLDAPLGDDPDGDTLSDLIPDESIIPDDERLLIREIVETVRAAVDALPEDIAPVIRAVELQGLTRAETARRMGVPQSTVRKLHGHGLRDLRRNRSIRALSDLDQETRFHAHKGVSSFQRDWTSTVEEAVIWREEQRAKHGKNQDKET